MDEEYFVIVKANVWDEDVNDIKFEIKLFKIASCVDLGKQLDIYYGKDLHDFSVEWIGDGSGSLDLDDAAVDALRNCN